MHAHYAPHNKKKWRSRSTTPLPLLLTMRFSDCPSGGSRCAQAGQLDNTAAADRMWLAEGEGGTQRELRREERESCQPSSDVEAGVVRPPGSLYDDGWPGRWSG